MATGALALIPVLPAGVGLSPQLAAFASPPTTIPGIWNPNWPTTGGAIGAVPTPPILGTNESGAWWPSYELLWWNQVHIIPREFDLGFVLADVSRTFEVFNNYHRAQILQSITFSPGTDGITVDTGPSPPAHYATTQAFDYVLRVPAVGSATINEIVSFGFGSFDVTMTVTGSRITAWALTPDWTNGVRERLEFKTDVMIAWTGAEQRRALRISPRRIFEFDIQMGDRDRRYIESALFAWSSQVFGLPIWPDGQPLPSAVAAGANTVTCDTVNRDFVAGGLGIIIGADSTSYEILQIDTVAAGSVTLVQPTISAWPQGSKLYPARAARLVSWPRITRHNDSFATMRPQFVVVEPCDWPAATGLPMYRGLPVLEIAPDNGSNPEAAFERQAYTLDPGTGVFSVLDTAQTGFPVVVHHAWLYGRAQRAAFRSLVYTLKGRRGELWVPTYQADLELVVTVTPSIITIDVQFSGYSLFLAEKLNRRDIRIELTNGTIYYRRITDSIVVDANTERLTIDSALGTTVTPAQVRRISFMAPSRLNNDTLDIEHHASANGLATCDVPFRALKKDV